MLGSHPKTFHIVRPSVSSQPTRPDPRAHDISSNISPRSVDVLGDLVNPLDDFNDMIAFLTDTPEGTQTKSRVASHQDLPRPESDLEMDAILKTRKSTQDLASYPSSTQHLGSSSSTPSTSTHSTPSRETGRSSASRNLPRMQPPPKSLPPLQPPPKCLPPILPPMSPPPTDAPPRKPQQRASKSPQPRLRSTMPSISRSECHTSFGVVLDDDTTVLDHETPDEPPIYFRTSTVDRSWLMRGFDDTGDIYPVVSPVVEISQSMPPLSPRSPPRRTSSTSGLSGSTRLVAGSSICSSPSPTTPHSETMARHPSIGRSPSIPSTLETSSIVSPTSSTFHSPAYRLHDRGSNSTRIAPRDHVEQAKDYEQLTWVFASATPKVTESKRRFGRRDKNKDRNKDKDSYSHSDDSSAFGGVSRARGLVRKMWS